MNVMKILSLLFKILERQNDIRNIMLIRLEKDLSH